MATRTDASPPDPTRARRDERRLARLRSTPVRRLSLTELADLHGTDKGAMGPSPEWPAHHYTDVYDAVLAPWRDREVTVLEVGMGVPGDHWEARIAHGRNEGGGASVRMWRDYFGRGQVHGADINPAPHVDGERLTTHVVDQGDRAALERLREALGPLDLVVDDGSHNPEHQQLTLQVLWPALRPGGVYVVEDLLANGAGDGRDNRMSSDRVLNTRKVLRGWLRDGAFPQPHALGDTAVLERELECLTLHCAQGPERRGPEKVALLRKAG